MQNILKSLLIVTILLTPIFPKMSISSININYFQIILIALLLNTTLLMIKKNLGEYRIYKFNIMWLFCLLILLFIGFMNSLDGYLIKIKFNELINLISYVFIILLFSLFNNEKTIKYLMIPLMILNFIFTYTSMIEIILDKHVDMINFTENINKNTQIQYATGIFYNPNNLSVFLIITFMLSHFFIKNNILKFSQIFLISYIVFINDSTICLVVFILFLFLYCIKNYNISRKIFILSVACLIFLLGVFVNLNKNLAIDFEKSDTFEVRLNLIKEGIKLSLSKPFGYGPSMFSHVFNGTYETQYIKAPHSLFIEIMVNYGYLGLISFIIFIYILILQSKKLSETSTELSTIYFSTIGLILCFFVISTSFNFSLFWITFAIIISLSNYRMNSSAGIKEKIDYEK
ncbi:O-antigen ligase family protein [Macrococcoides bohemicum]|uniref:O-antigen ligase family protein n=1 Tax=Macrococcoides bohemicum TaxID=1903056 RepID=UPI001C5F95C1|nr:O-antigen ligase family protein [Macrococcus bohemicus]QYA44585.1 O-antigen ligase family protein [Macrococcus bohemicus]